MKTETLEKITLHIVTFIWGFCTMAILGVFFPDMIVIRHPKPDNPCDINLPANAVAHGVGAGTWMLSGCHIVYCDGAACTVFAPPKEQP